MLHPRNDTTTRQAVRLLDACCATPEPFDRDALCYVDVLWFILFVNTGSIVRGDRRCGEQYMFCIRSAQYVTLQDIVALEFLSYVILHDALLVRQRIPMENYPSIVNDAPLIAKAQFYSACRRCARQHSLRWCVTAMEFQYTS